MKTSPCHLLVEQILQKSDERSPLIVGIVGPMGIGKSTFTLELQKILQSRRENRVVSTVSTDGFLCPNNVLQERGAMSHKGFPESFHNDLYLEFVKNLRKDEYELFSVPYYCQMKKDIDPDRFQKVTRSDIYLLEGINLFFPLAEQSQTSLADLYDEVVYLSMPQEDVQLQNSARFDRALEAGKKDSMGYFSELRHASPEDIEAYKKNLFETIHKPFQKTYLKPYQNLATVQIALEHEEPFHGKLSCFQDIASS